MLQKELWLKKWVVNNFLNSVVCCLLPTHYNPMDLTKLQSILANAQANEEILAKVRKNMTQITHLLDEIGAMLEPSYQPAKKERKAGNSNVGGGSKRGRPKKNTTAE